MTVHLDNPDLARDPAARRAAKEETVQVQFAAGGGSLISAVGLNHYVADDALITGSTGDRWCVSRARFDAKYLAVPPTPQGAAGPYRNRPVTVLAKQMHQAFSVSREAGGDVLHGSAGDWLLQYAPGDHGIVDRARFARVYRIIDGTSA
jgi:PGDYG protein